jgi:hypothetical protein
MSLIEQARSGAPAPGHGDGVFPDTTGVPTYSIPGSRRMIGADRRIDG